MSRGRVLCIHPWIYDFAAYDLWVRPLGLLSIAAVLRQHGYTVRLIDCLDRAHPALLRHQGLSAPQDQRYGCGHYPREIVAKPPLVQSVPRYFRRYGLPEALFEQELRAQDPPDVVLVTSKMTYWYLGVQAVIRRVKAVYPEVPVLLGGTYATLCTEHARRHSGADIVIPGEGEWAALEQVNRLLGHPQAPSLPREYPIPAHDLIHHRKAAAILTTRGCPFRCTYCAAHRLWPRFRRVAPQRVLAEIDRCFELGARHIAFYDDALLINAEAHIHPILDGILERGYPIDFHTPNAVHAAAIDRELAHKLYRAGFRTLRMGLETVDPEHQKRTGGKISNEAFTRAVRYLREAGFSSRELAAYVLIGLPGQSLEEVATTVRFAQRQGVQAKLAFYSPIPGTVDWDRAVAAGQIPPDADPLLHNNTLLPLRTGISWEELERFKRWVHAGNAALD